MPWGNVARAKTKEGEGRRGGKRGLDGERENERTWNARAGSSETRHGASGTPARGLQGISTGLVSNDTSASQLLSSPFAFSSLGTRDSPLTRIGRYRGIFFAGELVSCENVLLPCSLGLYLSAIELCTIGRREHSELGTLEDHFNNHTALFTRLRSSLSKGCHLHSEQGKTLLGTVMWRTLRLSGESWSGNAEDTAAGVEGGHDTEGDAMVDGGERGLELLEGGSVRAKQGRIFLRGVYHAVLGLLVTFESIF